MDKTPMGPDSSKRDEAAYNVWLAQQELLVGDTEVPTHGDADWGQEQGEDV